MPNENRTSAEIARLWAVTNHRKKSNYRTVLRAYMMDLTDYGQEPVRLACAKLRREAEWFPSLAELLREVSAEQSRMEDTVRRANTRLLPPVDETPVNPEVQERLRELAERMTIGKRRAG